MDSETERLCIEELTHLVCDAKGKVTIKEVSNNWNVSLKDSEVVLTKWLTKYKGDHAILKEYLIRGNDLNGNCVISVVPERKLEALGSLCPNFCSSLFSVELTSDASKRLPATNLTESKIMNLLLKSDKRVGAVEPPPPPAKVEIKSIKHEVKSPAKPSTSAGSAAHKNFFGASSQVKREPKTTATANGSTNGVIVKEEKKSPAKKDVPKSISSFFSSKPAGKSTAAVKEATTSVTNKTNSVTAAKTEKEAKPSANNNKRSFSDTNASATEDKLDVPKEVKEPTKKKIRTESSKPTAKASSSRSRILAICDSSSDDEDTSKSAQAKTPEPKSDEDVVMKEKENTTPEKTNGINSKESTAHGDGPKKHRVKGKKMVTRTYEDEEGYINTVQEMVEYSCSEEEDNATQSTSAPQTSTKTEAPAAKPVDKGKKKVSPPVAKTQKSILTFFSKK